jgi:hypothetical protein
MGNPDRITYGRRGRLRVALSSQAAELADSARGLVSTYADDYSLGGEFAEAAARIAADAKELLELAVAYERRRGTSWEVIGETLGITRQAAHDRFAAADKALQNALVESWLLGDDPRFPGLPDGAADAAQTADILDRWVTRNLQATDPLAHKPEGDPGRARPVSHNLPAADSLEHSTMLTAGMALLADARKSGWSDSEQGERTRRLELGIARRKVEFYERLVGEEASGVSRIGDHGTVQDLLAEARARLAELEAAAPSQGG